MILTKYYTLFQQSYGGDHQWFVTMLAYMKNTKDPNQRRRYANGAVTAYIKKNRYDVFPAMMSSAFDEVERFLVKHVDDIDDSMIQSLMNYDELDGTAGQKTKALKAYDMMKKDPANTRPKEHQSVQKYLTDLLAGKVR